MFAVAVAVVLDCVSVLLSNSVWFVLLLSSPLSTLALCLLFAKVDREIEVETDAFLI